MVWYRAGIRGDFLSVCTDFFTKYKRSKASELFSQPLPERRMRAWKGVNPHALYHVMNVYAFFGFLFNLKLSLSDKFPKFFLLFLRQGLALNYKINSFWFSYKFYIILV